jgi:hypothetical protein
MSSLTVSEVLRKAADLIEPEGAWIQEQDAVDVDGMEVMPIAPEACQWCALGAIGRYGAPSTLLIDGALAALIRAIGYGDDVVVPWPNRLVADWNDAESRTQDEVVAALRKAADLAEQEAR